MSKYIDSKPVFIPSYSQQNISICQCPLPIITLEGYYGHIVKPNINYRCTECGTVMRLVKGDNL